MHLNISASNTAHIEIDGGKAYREALQVDHFDRKKLVAGLAMAGGIGPATVEAFFSATNQPDGEQAVTAAIRRWTENQCSYHSVAYACAQAYGAAAALASEDRQEILKAAYAQTQELSAFSTNSFGSIVRETADVSLYAGWSAATSNLAAMRLARKVPAENFKEQFNIALNSDDTFDRVPLSGEVKNASLSGESYMTKVEDFAKLIMLNRQDLVNGGSATLVQTGLLLGGMAARTLEREVLRLLVNAPTGFFITADTDDRRKNALAANPLSKDGIYAASAALRRQVSGPGKVPLSYEPNVLLVGDEDAALAQELTSPSGPFPSITPIISQWLHSELIRDTVAPSDWYLASVSPLGAPLLLSFLNGVERPVISREGSKFNFFATGLQAVLPVGIALADPRAIVRSEG